MKKFIISMLVICNVAFIAQAQQAQGQLKTARKDMAVAKADLKQAQQDSIAEYHQFRTESLAQIEENKNTIENLRAAKVAREKVATEVYDEKVKALETKNKALKESVVNYRADGNTNWVAFKREFNKQMEALRQSFLDSRE
jgi:hypothetical protein